MTAFRNNDSVVLPGDSAAGRYVPTTSDHVFGEAYHGFSRAEKNLPGLKLGDTHASNTASVLPGLALFDSKATKPEAPVNVVANSTACTGLQTYRPVG